MEGGRTIHRPAAVKSSEFRRIMVIVTVSLLTIGENCCRVSRPAPIARARFNQHVRIEVDLSALRRRNQVWPAAPVAFDQSKANADELGDIESVPLRLPARRLVG